MKQEIINAIAKEINRHYQALKGHVLKKWLQMREKGGLSPGEILHYIKICRALELTVKYRKEIDGLYSQLEKTL